MKTQILLPLLTLVAALCGPSAVFGQADNILGWYWAPAKDGIVEIYKNGNTYEGKTVWILKPLTDRYNPDPAKRHHSLLGMVYLKGFVYRNGEYVNGTIYNPDNGNTYSAKLWMDGEHLMMRGFIGISLIGKTERLENADECRRSLDECIDSSRGAVGSNK
jgi:uncharacterized protein (DUF2147 family)